MPTIEEEPAIAVTFGTWIGFTALRKAEHGPDAKYDLATSASVCCGSVCSRRSQMARLLLVVRVSGCSGPLTCSRMGSREARCPAALRDTDAADELPN